MKVSGTCGADAEEHRHERSNAPRARIVGISEPG